MKNFQLNFITDKVKLRWFQILKELESTGICTTAQLIGMTNSTARTLVNDINYLREYFENVADIQSSKQGYSLNIHSSETYLEKKERFSKMNHSLLFLNKFFQRTSVYL
ncbi:HTH domain-containing protein [Enterococcus mundtii]|nr:HTH domain-containing protein [Enterococcus mundtii]